MNKLFSILSGCILATTISNSASAQAFRKGSLLISASEGYTSTVYTTYNNHNVTDNKVSGSTDGDRDPLTFEYGLSKRWGVGLNMGGDILHVSPSRYYGLSEEGVSNVKVITSEVTADVHYHFFVTGHTDLSALVSVGLSGMQIDGGRRESRYRYSANGTIARTGVEARYYVTRRFGFLGMATAFSESLSTKDVKDNTFGNNYSTAIKGWAVEFGVCVRALK